MPSVADALRAFAPAYLKRFGESVPVGHSKVLNAITKCRTGELGSVIYACEGCGRDHWVGRSCGNRHCPSCQHDRTIEWTAKQVDRLMPVSYFCVTFTVPQEIGLVLRANQGDGYRILFDAADEALRSVAANTRVLRGTELGYFGVLHMWGRNPMTYHPHVHFVVPGGGVVLNSDGQSIRWRTTADDFLVRRTPPSAGTSRPAARSSTRLSQDPLLRMAESSAEDRHRRSPLAGVYGAGPVLPAAVCSAGGTNRTGTVDVPSLRRQPEAVAGEVLQQSPDGRLLSVILRQRVRRMMRIRQFEILKRRIGGEREMYARNGKRRVARGSGVFFERQKEGQAITLNVTPHALRKRLPTLCKVPALKTEHTCLHRPCIRFLFVDFQPPMVARSFDESVIGGEKQADTYAHTRRLPPHGSFPPRSCPRLALDSCCVQDIPSLSKTSILVQGTGTP